MFTCKRLTSCTRGSFTTGTPGTTGNPGTTGTPGHTLQGWISCARNGAHNGETKEIRTEFW